MAAAWIGFAGGVIATVVSALVAVRQSHMTEHLTRMDKELEVEVNERKALFERDLRAEGC